MTAHEALSWVAVLSEVVGIPCFLGGCLAASNGQGEGGELLLAGFACAAVAAACFHLA